MRYVIPLAIFVLALQASAGDIKHRFAATDESGHQVIYVDERHPSTNWAIPLRARDIQLVGNDRIMVSVDNGYHEYELKTGKLAKKVDGYQRVSSVQRIANGNTYVACKDGIVILDPNDKKIGSVPARTGRLFRITNQNTLILVNGANVSEFSMEGKQLLNLMIPESKKGYVGQRIENGNILFAAGMTGQLLEINRSGKIIKRYGGIGKHNVTLKFFADFQLLENGDVVVCNWLGHKKESSKSGPQLVEFSKNNKIVWQWHDPDFAGCVHGVVILDGLDTSKIHDERTGYMRPLTQQN